MRAILPVTVPLIINGLPVKRKCLIGVKEIAGGARSGSSGFLAVSSIGFVSVSGSLLTETDASERLRLLQIDYAFLNSLSTPSGHFGSHRVSITLKKFVSYPLP